MKNAVTASFAGPGSGLLLLVAVIPAVLLYLAWRQDATLADENHLLENVQVASLLLAALLHVFRVSRLPSPTGSPARMLSTLLAFLCLGCALRELDIDDLGDSRYFEPLETGLRALALGALGFYLLRHLTRLPAVCLLIVRERGDSLVLLSLLGIVFYVASWPLDKKVILIAAGVALWFEEMLELYACSLLLAAALAKRRQARPAPA